MEKNKIIELSGEDFLICEDLVVDNVNYLYKPSDSSSPPRIFLLDTRTTISGFTKVFSAS